MRDRTRRYESGKMLMDVAKYSATVAGIGSFATQAPNWKMAMGGWSLALLMWLLGYWIIPQDKEEKR